MKEFNRRDFIKSSSIMAGISLTGTTSIPSVLSRQARCIGIVEGYG